MFNLKPFLFFSPIAFIDHSISIFRKCYCNIIIHILFPIKVKSDKGRLFFVSEFLWRPRRLSSEKWHCPNRRMIYLAARWTTLYASVDVKYRRTRRLSLADLPWRNKAPQSRYRWEELRWQAVKERIHLVALFSMLNRSLFVFYISRDVSYFILVLRSTIRYKMHYYTTNEKANCTKFFGGGRSKPTLRD